MSQGVIIDEAGCVAIDESGCVGIGDCTGYLLMRRCDGTLTTWGMTTADAATLTTPFTLMHGNVGYYFAGDTGTPDVVFTADEATPYASCAAITAGCPNGICADHADDTASYNVDFSGPWDLAGCGQTADTTSATSQPLTMTVSGCSYTFGSDCKFPSPTPGDIYRFSAPVIFSQNTLHDGSGTPCWYYAIQMTFQDFHGGPNRTVYFRGPRLNGTGSAAGDYFWWFDSTSTAAFDENDVATDGCTFGLVPPKLVVA